MRIGFIVDHPKRDLPSGVMLSAAFARRGFNTALIPMYEQGIDVPLLKLDALIVNFARPTNIDIVRQYSKFGLPIWVLDTEGGVLADDGANSPDRMAKYIRDSGYQSLLRGYFFWGETLRDAFAQYSGMREDQLHVTGCPRFDYAAGCWRDILKHHRKNYILINANFPLVNPRFVKSARSELGVLTAAGWSSDYVKNLLNDSKLIFEQYVESVRALAKRFPNKLFLLRPHPFENPLKYVEMMRGIQNVEVDGEGGVLNVIHNAECVLHLNCGTAIESILLDKVPISMEFLNTKFMSQHSSLPSRVSFRISSQQALFEALEDLGSIKAKFPFFLNHTKMIFPWFHKNDGKSSDRIADVIVKDLSFTRLTKPKVSVRVSLASSREHPRFGQRFQSLIANVLGSKNSANIRAIFASKRQDKILSQQTVAQEFYNVTSHSGQAGEYKVKQARHPLTGFPLASLLIER